MTLFPAEIIKKKRNGINLSQEEIQFFISEYVVDRLPDYQMAAFLMAVYFEGMNALETTTLTQVMRDSGVVLDFSGLSLPAVDKHSTGGVGDKTSMILAPIVAAAGVPIPMIAGRGLGHTGGTLDKLEAIPGCSVQLSMDQFQKQVREFGVSIIGQTEEICPADKRIYALRDVTATVESLPLICASIMSKKLAEGINCLVLDVKFGSGAFMKSKQQAQALAEGLMAIGLQSGKKVVSLLTSMEQPLGYYAGNSLEIMECVQILKNEDHPLCPLVKCEDARELSLQLAGWMLHLAGVSDSAEEGYKKSLELILSGQAYKKFDELIKLQGGDLSQLPMPSRSETLYAEESGYLESFNCEQIGVAGIALKAGRMVKTDEIDPVAGISFPSKIGDFIKRDDPIFVMHGSNSTEFKEARQMLSTCYKLSAQPPRPHELLWKVLK